MTTTTTTTIIIVVIVVEEEVAVVVVLVVGVAVAYPYLTPLKHVHRLLCKFDLRFSRTI